MERNAFLINKKIHQYILPGMLMTVAMQLGNVVDGMIVGNLLGAEAMAAIEISMPVLLLLQMAALMLAMGGAAEAAVFLGKRDMETASGVFTASLVAGLAISVFFALFTPILPGPAAMLLAGLFCLCQCCVDCGIVCRRNYWTCSEYCGNSLWGT